MNLIFTLAPWTVGLAVLVYLASEAFPLALAMLRVMLGALAQ